MKYLGASLLSLSLFTSLEAAICVDINSKNLLKCVLSSRHHNRIAVEDQRIKKIIYPEGEVLIRIEEETGQIFVQAMVEKPSETTVSIVTNKGTIQDLELSFTDKSSEILILKDIGKAEESCLANSIDCEDELSLMQDCIEKMMSGNIPEEYVPVEDRKICCQIKSDLILKSIMRLVGPVYTVYVMHIENIGRRCEFIHESDLNCVKGEWIFVERHQLERNQKMMALIGVRTYEQ